MQNILKRNKNILTKKQRLSPWRARPQTQEACSVPKPFMANTVKCSIQWQCCCCPSPQNGFGQQQHSDYRQSVILCPSHEGHLDSIGWSRAGYLTILLQTPNEHLASQQCNVQYSFKLRRGQHSHNGGGHSDHYKLCIPLSVTTSLIMRPSSTVTAYEAKKFPTKSYARSFLIGVRTST